MQVLTHRSYCDTFLLYFTDYQILIYKATVHLFHLIPTNASDQVIEIVGGKQLGVGGQPKARRPVAGDTEVK